MKRRNMLITRGPMAWRQIMKTIVVRAVLPWMTISVSGVDTACSRMIQQACNTVRLKWVKGCQQLVRDLSLH